MEKKRERLLEGSMAWYKEKKKEDLKTCMLEYEYLPDFFFTCGIIGHVDRACSIKLKKGEV